MANYITVGTIGAAPPTGGCESSMPQLVEKMASFWETKLQNVWPDRPDLVVLPEICDRYVDFTSGQLSQFCIERGAALLELFQRQACLHRCYIVYPSLRQLEDGSWRNSLRVIGRSGEIVGTYDKNHCVIGEREDYGVLCGTSAPLIECDFGRIAGAICFDLNFDALRLQYKAAKPDIVVFPSMYHGGLMQSYWAYSCRAHFVAAVAGLPSAILSPLGATLASTTNYFDFVTTTVNLDCRLAHLDFNWGKIKTLKQKYGRGVTITDPGNLGSVLITSEEEGLTADALLSEFEIEHLDDYIARSIAHRGEQAAT